MHVLDRLLPFDDSTSYSSEINANFGHLCAFQVPAEDGSRWNFTSRSGSPEGIPLIEDFKYTWSGNILLLSPLAD